MSNKLKTVKNTPSRQKYVHLYEEITTLWLEGKTRKYICDKYGFSTSLTHNILKRCNLKNPLPKSVDLDYYEKSVLIGTIMGDTHILKGSNKTSSINFAHYNKHKEYFDFKVNILKKLGKGFNKEYSKIDKRTGNTYISNTYTSLSFLELKTLRFIFYPNGKKILPIEYLKNNFNEISLAYLYMDDGSSYKYNTIISLQCYEREELLEFIDLLKTKFDLDFTLQSNKTLRIKQKDVSKFKELIKSEVEKIKCMEYKILCPH